MCKIAKNDIWDIVIVGPIYNILSRRKHWALCSKNFQNVKLNFALLEIDSFTWNQIWVNSNGQKRDIFGKCRGSEFWF